MDKIPANVWYELGDAIWFAAQEGPPEATIEPISYIREQILSIKI